MVAAAVLTSLVGLWVSGRAARLLGDKDPSSVVIDESAGVLIAAAFVHGSPLWILAVAFGLFRVLDITKPSVIDRAQYWGTPAVGIMADDILAGLGAGAASLALSALV